MTHASLFSGIGGPEIAASMMGWENAFHCEINPFCRAVLEYWFPESKSYADITKTDFHEWGGKIDVLTGGFPCQPFSRGGNRRGNDDDRYLWPEMLRVIEEIRPTWVVGENVNDILSMVEPGEVVQMGRSTPLFGEIDDSRETTIQRSTFTIERICQDIERAGYSVQPMLIPASAVGACHRRNRVFILARRNDSLLENDDKDPLRVGLHEAQKLGNESRSGDARTDGPIWDSASSPGFRTEWTGIGWRPFVTVVLGGDNGLSTDVDYLTIPFDDWRAESLKAYGNAIVPQVMYRIFQAIQSVTP